ncbi:unnamed protein product [Caenorhabditis auriculariae]|uniref:Protein kinase domain-containing protein n=1 Tax=Caenorhabditis auriculariae TaxID=2777116 RepID=A0A8S1GSW5_9PELO|nr:unnamed protein product [Caenorhabditis auriculariae]
MSTENTPESSKVEADKTMPQVGFIIEQDEGNKWRVLRNVYSGPFSDVYIVSDVKSGVRYAMKCEKTMDNARSVLRLDVLVLRATIGLVGFPHFIAAGRTFNYKYCVMQLVGPDLGRLRRTRPDKKFTMATALRILDQTLTRLENLHDAGWLCRDVKAPNFAIGLDTDESTIFMLDFGFARKFKDSDGKVIPPRAAAALMGTFQYCAVSAHSHKDQSAKDDLESWFYMAIELLKGPLPWAAIDGRKNHKLIGEQKQLIRSEPAKSTFFSGVPIQFQEILQLIDGTGFSDRPCYARLRELLHQAAFSNSVTLREPFDWENNQRMQNKADFVGELGESNLASARLDAKNSHDLIMESSQKSAKKEPHEETKPVLLASVPPIAVPVQVPNLGPTHANLISTAAKDNPVVSTPPSEPEPHKKEPQEEVKPVLLASVAPIVLPVQIPNLGPALANIISTAKELLRQSPILRERRKEKQEEEAKKTGSSTDHSHDQSSTSDDN